MMVIITDATYADTNRLELPWRPALELSPGPRAGATRSTRRLRRPRRPVARDLARRVPEAATLTWAGRGLYDPVELLRPGYPLHAELEQLVARATGAAAARDRFGAGPDGLPGALHPHPNMPRPAAAAAAAAARHAADIARVGDQLEKSFSTPAWPARETALLAQTASPSRSNTRPADDQHLAAMIALHTTTPACRRCGHWSRPRCCAGKRTWLDAAPEPLLRLRRPRSAIALLDIDAWAEGGFAPPTSIPHNCARVRAFPDAQRQFAPAWRAWHPGHVRPLPAGRNPRGVLSA